MGAADSKPSFGELPEPRRRPIDRLLRPIRSFMEHKLAGAGLLMLATAVALFWANSRWGEHYQHILHTELVVGVGGLRLAKSLQHWINDGLMSVFFFLVGLEIKREIMIGELSSLRKATLPAVAALGGMVVPALLYLAVNPELPARRGWGVPMATDIAFALGVLALLGKRVPLGLKVFLTALAIVDDIGAVLVIAVFYAAELSPLGLVVGGVAFLVAVGLNALGARDPGVYFVVTVIAWLGFVESGVHATIAAILMAFTIPARTRIEGEAFASLLSHLLERLRTVGLPRDRSMNSPPQQQLFEQMNEAIDMVSAPLQRIEHSLAGLVTFLVLPLFALANAGVTVTGDLRAALGDRVVLGVVVGLCAGKTIGISGAALVAVKLGIADLPQGVSPAQLVGVAMLGGIGFTMALFVATLAFPAPAMVETAKLGILAASLVSAVLGLTVVRLASPKAAPPE